MFLAPIVRPSKIIFISSPTQDVNLYSLASSPTYPANILCFINANVTSSNANVTAAFRTGTSWTPGTWIYVENNAKIEASIGYTGAPGAAGTDGAYASAGADGAGGVGGTGANHSNAGGAGSGGGTGDVGGTGGNGGDGVAGGQHAARSQKEKGLADHRRHSSSRHQTSGRKPDQSP